MTALNVDVPPSNGGRPGRSGNSTKISYIFWKKEMLVAPVVLQIREKEKGVVKDISERGEGEGGQT